MPFAVKLSDVVSDRGVLVGPLCHLNVRINDIPLALGGAPDPENSGKATGTQVAPHACCGSPGCEIHCLAFMTVGLTAPRILVNGTPILVGLTDVATCLEPANRQAIPSAVFVKPL